MNEVYDHLIYDYIKTYKKRIPDLLLLHNFSYFQSAKCVLNKPNLKSTLQRILSRATFSFDEKGQLSKNDSNATSCKNENPSKKLFCTA